jgi:hypothetical protein
MAEAFDTTLIHLVGALVNDTFSKQQDDWAYLAGNGRTYAIQRIGVLE